MSSTEHNPAITKQMTSCCTETLYLENRARLLRLILSRVDDVSTAEDLLQDSFEKIENCCKDGCECAHPRSYLFRTALNTVADFFRKKKKTVSIDERFSGEIEIADKGESQLSFDIYECIYKYLSHLSEDNQRAYTMVDIEQIPQVEVARKLGIPLSTLKSRVQRTRAHLKVEIQRGFSEIR